MSKTERTLEKLPGGVRKAVGDFKQRYNDKRFKQDIVRAEARGYLKGIKDAEILDTDTDFRILFTYITL
jgi:hypothetical protein